MSIILHNIFKSSVLWVSIFLTILIGCNKDNAPLIPIQKSLTGSTAKQTSDTNDDAAKKNNGVRVGFLYYGSINDEGYTTSHDKARRALLNEGFNDIFYVENVPATSDCEIVLRDLINMGCNIIYSTTYNFLDATLKVARNFPNVKFAHCSGGVTTDNVASYFGRMYEARYLTGIVAGLKTKTNLIAYVAAFPLPECIRGVNAFALGVQSVNKDAKVILIYTNTWYDATVEKAAALKVLREYGCDVITQHQDTTAAQVAAAECKAYCIGYNLATPSAAPASYLTSAIFDWSKFIIPDVHRVIDGTWKPDNFWGGLDTGVVDIAPLSLLCAVGTGEKVANAKKSIIDGTLKIFAGPITDCNGKLRVEKGVRMTDTEIWNMNYLIQGVKEVR